jgi:simple sugar transport system substrate-binding protein/ribose transport system substrate-binding protein
MRDQLRKIGRRKRTLAGVGVVCGMAAALAATAGVAASAPQASSASGVKGFKLAPYIAHDVKTGKLNYVYITNDLTIPYTTSQREGVAKASKEFHVSVKLVGPPTGLAQDQVSLMQTLVTQHKVDGIVIAAVDVNSLAPVIAQAFNAGIPVVTAFTDQPNSKQLAYIGEQNEKFGVYEGRLLAKALKGKKGKVVMISVDTAAGWSTARIAGLKQGLATNPGLIPVGPINTGAEPAQEYNAIQNAMTANPGALAIASVDCCSVDGAGRWAELTHNVGKVTIIGTDALNQTISYIRSGAVSFSISQDPIGQVTGAIKDIYLFETKGIVPKTKLLPPLLVNKQDLAKITPEG